MKLVLDLTRQEFEAVFDALSGRVEDALTDCVCDDGCAACAADRLLQPIVDDMSAILARSADPNPGAA